jgi:hypothetical protein
MVNLFAFVRIVCGKLGETLGLKREIKQKQE